MAYDPNRVHSDVASCLDEIARAVKGEEVRGSIYDAIELIDARSVTSEATMEAIANNAITNICLRFTLYEETSRGICSARANIVYELISAKKPIVPYIFITQNATTETENIFTRLYSLTSTSTVTGNSRPQIKCYRISQDASALDCYTITFSNSITNEVEWTKTTVPISGGSSDILPPLNITFTLDSANTSYIECDTSWEDIEEYMDNKYGTWHDYEAWGELSRNCILIDKRVDQYSTDNRVYTLIGVDWPRTITGFSTPRLLFAKQSRDNDSYASNNVHYISFEWETRWDLSDSQYDFEEFDGSTGGGDSYTAGDAIDITNNVISIGEPVYITMTEGANGIADTSFIVSITEANFLAKFGIGAKDLMAILSGSYNVAKLGIKVLDDTSTSMDAYLDKIPILDIRYSKYDEELSLSEAATMIFIWDHCIYEFVVNVEYSDEFRGTVSKINGYIAKTKVTSNGYGITGSGNSISVDTSVIQKKLTSTNAGTGISITNDGQGNPVISLDLPQAEGGGF